MFIYVRTNNIFDLTHCHFVRNLSDDRLLLRAARKICLMQLWPACFRGKYIVVYESACMEVRVWAGGIQDSAW